MKKTITIFILFIVLLVACDDSSGPIEWNNGSWHGVTATSIPITFKLDHPTITDWTMTSTHVYADTTDIRTWLCPSLAVTDDSTFAWRDTIDQDTLKYVFSFSGRFINGDSLTGQWDSSVEYRFSNESGTDEAGGSWTATGPE